MLHGVMDDQDENSQWHPFRSYISRQGLETSLALLKRYYKFISIDQAMDLLDGKAAFKRQYCVMTFDDGLRNNLTHAMPILRRHQIPAVMYLVTDQIEHQEPFWFDRLDYAIQNAAPSTKSIQVFGKIIKIERGGVKSLKRTFLNIKNAAFNTQHTYPEINVEILRVTEELERQSGKSLLDIYHQDPWSRIMTWEDVESTAHAPDVTMGSHTVDHSLLGKISDDAMEYQLKASKEAIEKHTSRPCVHFCYPNGSLNPKAAEYLRLTGYTSAVSTQRGSNKKMSFDRYALKRYNMPAHRNSLYTLAMICGLLDVRS